MEISLEKDEKYMRLALEEAKLALEADEVPIGAIIVAGGRIVGRGHNLVETLVDVTAHAEIQAITAAASTIGGKYLNDCTLYVTVEPCPMCAWAISMSGISVVYFGSYNQQYGALESSINLPLNPNLKIYGGIMEVECNKILEEFFKSIRDDNKNRIR